MPAVAFARTAETSPSGIAASLLLHAILIAALLLSPAVHQPKQPSEQKIAVDVLTPQQYRSAIAPPNQPAILARRPAATPVLPDAETAVAPPAPEADRMIRPTKMLSAATFADPRSKQARADLATFASSERRLQLCNVEAMDQIHAWRADFLPVQVVAYATASEKIAGDTIVAPGAAFLSRDNWYAVNFKCQLAPDGESVVAFEFQVGDPVPREKWDELDLPTGHDED